MSVLERIDALVSRDGRYAPRWGWHDDHRDADGTPAYLPALQQVRGEFAELLGELPRRYGFCLQLGIGETDASHEAWRCVFDQVVTVDWREIALDAERLAGADTRDDRALAIARAHGPYDLLFIDADHSYAGARRDHERYASLVRPGGVVAFHDALPRRAYPEVEVWRYVAELPYAVRVIGSEVGVAYYVVGE